MPTSVAEINVMQCSEIPRFRDFETSRFVDEISLLVMEYSVFADLYGGMFPPAL
jgi:hypothetical protein